MAATEPVATKLEKAVNFSEWYNNVVFETDLLKYYDVSGCYVMLPRSYNMWEQIQRFLDAAFKSNGVSNVYFPMLISETNLSRESSHIEGFTPEVAWVTQAGTTPLHNKLAIRPTSECAFYPTFAEIIKSHGDLPLKWNQWCSVLRWEFNDPTPFIRSREFLWNEGHCAFATKEEARENALEILDVYKTLYESVLCVPVIPGKKTNGERFAGADATYSLETFITEAGRGIQCATAHCLGQNFSKIFDIKYQVDGAAAQTKHVWQTSWGCTTRSIGTTIMVHGDDKGLVLPTALAEYHVVVVPIFTKHNEDIVKDFCKRVTQHYAAAAMNFKVYCDNRDRRPGWKYNHWESRGVPFRFEIGQKEVDACNVMIYNRITATKTSSSAFMSNAEMTEMLKKYDQLLYNNAYEKLHKSIIPVKDLDDDDIRNNKMYCGSLCENIECEKNIKKLKIKPMCRPFKYDMFMVDNKCVSCGEIVVDSYPVCLFARSF